MPAHPKLQRQVIGRFLIQDGDGPLSRETIYREGDAFYRLRCRFEDRNKQQEIMHGTLIPLESAFPKIADSTKLYMESVHDNVFLKTQSLSSRDSEEGRSIKLMEREIAVYERLGKDDAHPNLPEYFGVESIDGYAVSIAFARYSQSLSDFVKGTQQLTAGDIDKINNGLRSAVEYLHSKNYVHGDINPNNVMLRDDMSPVLVDFGSCVCIGAEDSLTFGTNGWYMTNDNRQVWQDYYGLGCINGALRQKYLHQSM